MKGVGGKGQGKPGRGKPEGKGKGKGKSKGSGAGVSSSYWTVYKKFASQSQHKYKIIIFFPAKQMTKQILAFLFCFKRELNPYSPLTLTLTLRPSLNPLLPP